MPPPRPEYVVVRDWPRGMPLDLAAEYCGISPSLLRKIGPTPVRIGTRRQIWLREDLDAWLDRAAGRSSAAVRNSWLED